MTLMHIQPTEKVRPIRGATKKRNEFYKECDVPSQIKDRDEGTHREMLVGDEADIII